MTPVFAHGSLRLYLLKLLDESPKHGYELIQAMTDRFGGTYSPSAGTIYPRLAKLEDEGLVTKSTDGRKSIYTITDAGRAELAAKADQLAAIENDLTDSVRRLADEVRSGVSAAMRSLRADLASAAREPEPHSTKRSWADWGFSNPWADNSPRAGEAGSAGHGAEASADAGTAMPGATAAGAAGSPAGNPTGHNANPPANPTPTAGSEHDAGTLDPRLAARLALSEAEHALNEARQQLRSELRRRASESTLAADDVRELRSRLGDISLWLRKR